MISCSGKLLSVTFVVLSISRAGLSPIFEKKMNLILQQSFCHHYFLIILLRYFFLVIPFDNSLTVVHVFSISFLHSSKRAVRKVADYEVVELAHIEHASRSGDYPNVITR